MVKGLDAGANDYLSKPFHSSELRARIEVGSQMLALQHKLAERVQELENALSEVRELKGMLPICSYCKSIRDDQNYWQDVENYITEHSRLEFSHGICPKCWEKKVEPELEEFRKRKSECV